MAHETERTALAAEALDSLMRSVARRNGLKMPCGADFAPLMTRFLESEQAGNVCLSLHRGKDALYKAAGELSGTPFAAQVSAQEFVSDGPEPFVLDNEGSVRRLYSARHYAEELELAKMVAELFSMAPDPLPEVSLQTVRALCEFPSERYAERMQAIERSFRYRFSVICGGPGTGKTTAVATLLAAFLAGRPESVIALAAPTGKAAGRMTQSIDSFRDRSGFGMLSGHELRASTIHRMLNDAERLERKIDADLLVIDECSMIDSALAHRLFSNIDAARTRVIMLGDKNQLSSVGPGAVFAALSDPEGPLGEAVSELTHSHRFDAQVGIGRLASLVLEGKVRQASQFLQESRTDLYQPMNWEITDRPVRSGLSDQARLLLEQEMQPYWECLTKLVRLPAAERLESVHVQSLWKAAQRFRCLCALRRGAMSINAVNDWADERRREVVQEALEGNALPAHLAQIGQIVIVRENSYRLNVFNGDVAILIGDDDGLQAYFGDADRMVSAALLPRTDPAFALTIHQSQGSEFHCVAVFLPEGESRLTSRELLYTAITRVKDLRVEAGGIEPGELSIFGSRKAFEDSVKTKTHRDGALSERLLAMLERC